MAGESRIEMSESGFAGFWDFQEWLLSELQIFRESLCQVYGKHGLETAPTRETEGLMSKTVYTLFGKICLTNFSFRV